MEKLSSCVLIAFSPDPHEAGSAAAKIRRTVKCTEKDVGLTEFYQANGIGLRPEARLLIPYERDYHGERELEYEGRRWRVIRKAGAEYNGVLLTIQPWDGNAADPPETPEETAATTEAAEVSGDAG